MDFSTVMKNARDANSNVQMIEQNGANETHGPSKSN